MAAEVAIGGSGALFVGEDKTIRLELVDDAGLPVDMASWVMLFDVRKKNNSAAPALISKTPTLSGTFNSVRASNTQRGVVTLTDTDMNLLVAKTYRYSWKRMDDASETVLAYGDFAPEKATAP